MGELACEVFWAGTGALLPVHGELLDAAERARVSGFRRRDDARRFTLAAALLRLVVGHRTGLAARRVRIDRTCPRCARPHGRPRVVGEALHVSVSHSSALAAVAITAAGPVGVDVERVCPLDHAAMSRLVGVTADRPAASALDAFYVTWTRKESVLKATGAGLDLAMAQVDVTPPDEPPRLRRYAGRAPMSAQMADTVTAPGYAGAVTVLTPAPVAFRVRHAGHLLAAV